MPLRFRRSVSLFPGARLNFSKSGVSVSLGRPGATFNFGPRGTSATFGLPGTGFSYRVQLSHRNRNRGSGEGSAPSSGNEWPSTPAPEAGSRRIYQPKEGEIASAPVGTLTSASLADLKQLILEARKRRIDLQGQLKIAIRARNAAYRWHWFRSRFPLRFLGAKGAEAAAEKSTERQVALEAVANALSSCFMRLSFQMPPQMAKAWEDLQAAHEALSRVQKIWDVTAEVAVDRGCVKS